MADEEKISEAMQRFVMTAIRGVEVAEAKAAKPLPTAEEVAREEARRNALLPLAYQMPHPKTREEALGMLPKVRDMFRYDPATGNLWFRHQEIPGAPDNWRSLATNPGRNGYATVNFYGMTIYAAQLVWLLHHDRWPNGRLKRRDGDTLNDRIENLYEPRSEVRAVQTGPRTRKNASRGVARCGPDHWQAYVRVGGRQINLGRFNTEAEAQKARTDWDMGADLV
jgi:hypothetical protein